jgi:hypothetical protein
MHDPRPDPSEQTRITKWNAPAHRKRIELGADCSSIVSQIALSTREKEKVGVDRTVRERREGLDHAGLGTTAIERSKNLNNPNWVLNAINCHRPIHLTKSLYA